MLLSCLGVPDQIFMDKLEAALKQLDRVTIHRRLKRQIMQAIEYPSTDIANLHREFELHFGPSHYFKQTFA